MTEIEKRGFLWTADAWRKQARALVHKWSATGTHEVQNETQAQQKSNDECKARTLERCAESIEGLCE